MSEGEDFQMKLAMGHEGELRIQEKLRGIVVPTGQMCQAGSETLKGGKLYRATEAEWIAPDLQELREGRAIWYEVKTKTRPGYLRRMQCHTHGVNLNHFRNYARVQRVTGSMVVIVVVEKSGPEGEQGEDLAISVDKAQQHGHEGRFGRTPSWCWPRHVMWNFREYPHYT